MTAPKLPRLTLIDASVFEGLSDASALVCGPDGCYPEVDPAASTTTSSTSSTSAPALVEPVAIAEPVAIVEPAHVAEDPAQAR